MMPHKTLKIQCTKHKRINLFSIKKQQQQQQNVLRVLKILFDTILH